MQFVAIVFLSILVLFIGGDCGGGGSGSGCNEVESGDLSVACSSSDAPDISEASSSDRVDVGCAGHSSGSATITCASTSESLTVSCNGGIIEDDDAVSGFASTSNCEDGQVSCFNGAINTTCVDTTTE